MKGYHFLVLGEDDRQHHLSVLLRECGNEVKESVNWQPGKWDGVLLPVPQSSVYFQKNIGNFQRGQVVYGWNIPSELVVETEKKGVRTVDYEESEGIAERNAVATAEGAVAEAMKDGCVSIQGSRCLVTGYGICGSTLASKLERWNALVTVMERKERKRELAKSRGYGAVSFSSDPQGMKKYDYIFNTVPAPVLRENLLQHVKKESVIIDIASSPGGVDFDYCQKKKICARLCPGLPGKYAPKSSAGILMEVIRKTFSGD